MKTKLVPKKHKKRSISGYVIEWESLEVVDDEEEITKGVLNLY